MRTIVYADRRRNNRTLGRTKSVAAKDLSSRATESSLSNMIALQHSIDQIYGEAASRGPLFQANPERETTP